MAGGFHPGPDPRRFVVGSAAAAALSLAAAAAAAATRGSLPFLLVLGLLGLASFAYLVWHVDPAWTLSGSIALSVFGGYWGQLGPFGYLPVTPDRLMLVAGAGALLLRAPGARHREPLRVEPVHWLLAGVIAFAVVSAFVSGTLLSKSEFFRLFDRFGVAPFLMFTLAPLAFPTKKHRKIFLGVLVALGGYLGLTALFETVGPHSLVFPRYITNPELGFHVGRARGPFLEAEANGIALFLCGTAAAVAATTWRSSALVKGFCWLVVCLCFAGCLFSLSRGVWLGTAVAIFLTLLFFRPVRGLLVPALAGIPLVVVLLISLVPGLAASIDDRGNDMNSVWDRENLNAAALRTVEARPLLGVGWGRFTDVGPPYFWQAKDRPLTAVGVQSCDSLPTGATQTADGSRPQCTVPVHNAYLSNAAELGLIGVTLWIVAGIVAIGGAVVRPGPPWALPWRIGLFAVAMMWGVVVFFTPLEGPFSAVVLWTWAGIVWASGIPVSRASSGGLA
ncbi:MAG: O-antigen ligase family protein [Solirubrobacterales bacterium]